MTDITIIVLTYERQLWISRFMLSLKNSILMERY